MALRIGLAAITACIFAALALAGDAPLAPGDLDTTFGTGGRIRIAVGSSDAQAFATALQADGKILLVGEVTEFAPPPTAPPPPGPLLPSRPAADHGDFLAIRLTQDGGLDPSFGSGGIVRTPINVVPDGPDVASGAAVTPDGKLVVAGTAYSSNGTAALAVVRYTQSGSLDTTLCGTGICTFDWTQYGTGYAVAVQPDGKILCAGEIPGGISLVRLLPNGDPDPNFGSGGVVHTSVGDPAETDRASAVLLQGDGRIVVAATADTRTATDFSLVRYQANGQLDHSFGTNGVVVAPAPDDQWAEAAALVPGGKIVVAGEGRYGGNSYEFRLARYNGDGSPDAGFGSGGIVTTRFGNIAVPAALAVQADGTLVAGGLDGAAGDVKFALVRYDEHGSLDAGFGDGGKRTYDVLPGSDFGYALAIQQVDSTERIVEAGSSLDGEQYVVSAARMQLGPPPPLPPQPPPLKPPCAVPKVVGLKLTKAKTRIKKSHCRVGRVRYKAAARAKRGKVLSQRPKARRRLANGARVNLVVGRRR